MTIDFLDRNLRKEMKEDLRTGGNAIEQHGYDVSYSIMVFDNTRVSVFEHDPEEAVDKFFEHMHETSHIHLQPRTEALLGLLEEGSQRDVKNAVNESLYQVKGKIRVYESGNREQSPELRHTRAEYRPQLHGGFFELPGPRGSKDYLYELREILQEEGLTAEIR